MSVGKPVRDRGGAMKARPHWARYLAIAIIAFLAGELAAASIGIGSAQGDPVATAGKSHANLPHDDAKLQKGGIE